MGRIFTAIRVTLWLGVLTMAGGAGLFYYQLDGMLQARDNGIVATISFEKLDRQTFQATLLYPDERVFKAPLHGDFWMVDARFISLKGPLRLFGTAPFYEIERLSGRYGSVSDEKAGIRSVYDLSFDEERVMPDLWSLSREYDLPWVDAKYGAAVYMPMSHGARYAIVLGTDGLKARPLTAPAFDAVQNWK
ncbi:hypothetical protein [Allohahella marinimesophila]|uniref:Uncharacterized protein n=1 Tax=Allohahella marinimesophila TaxID=1054972 RepID=A0ABP7NMS1_9GAMM